MNKKKDSDYKVVNVTEGKEENEEKIVNQDTKVIKNMTYYMAIVCSMCIVQTFMALTDVIVAPIFPIISKEFGWTTDNEQILLSVSQTAPILGQALANFLGFITKDYNPSKVVYGFKLLYLVAISCTLIKSTYILIIGRFFMGIAIGFQFPPSMTIIYEAAPPSLRAVNGVLLQIFFSLGLIIGYGINGPVNAKSFSWRGLYLVCIGISLVDILVQTFYLKKDLSPGWMLKCKIAKEEFYKSYGRYLMPQALDNKYTEIEAVNLSNQEGEKKKKEDEAKGKKKGFFSTNKNELIYGIKYAIIINFGLWNMTSAYQYFLITEDLDNNSESSFSNLMLMVASIVELVSKMCSIYFGWTVKRKRALTIGLVSLSISIAGEGVLQQFDV